MPNLTPAAARLLAALSPEWRLARDLDLGNYPFRPGRPMHRLLVAGLVERGTLYGMGRNGRRQPMLAVRLAP